MAPPKPSLLVSGFEKRYEKAKQQPFLDERLMDDAAIACAWENFRRPLLRRSNLQGKTKFIDLIGYGLDGICMEGGNWRMHRCAQSILGRLGS